jgi:hypothetical protein
MTEEILAAQKIIEQLTTKKESLLKKGGIPKWLWLKKTQRKISFLEDKQFYRISDYLFEQSPDFQQLANKNLSLLETSKIRFKVYANSDSPISAYTLRLSGYIHPNGYSYCESSAKQHLVGGKSYPTVLKGKIDYWGRIELKASSLNHSYIFNLPKSYVGSIDANGNVSLQVKEKAPDLIGNGGMSMEKIIANHFEYESDHNLFFSNYNEMIDLVHDTWNTIKS